MLVHSLMPSIVDLSNDRNWRIRLAIIEYVPLLAEQLGVALFENQLASLSMDWLGDDVFSIRQAATENLKKLTSTFGEEWARQNIIPKVVELQNSTNYLCRMQTLRAVEALSDVLSDDLFVSDLVPLVVNAAKDPVPNIRFNVAKCFENLKEKLSPAIVQNDVLPCLKGMAGDNDDDVVYYAQRAVDTVS